MTDCLYKLRVCWGHKCSYICTLVLLSEATAGATVRQAETRHRSSSITLSHIRILSQAYKHKRGPADDSQCEVLLRVAAIPQKPRPQLYANDAEDEEDKEAEEEDVAQHWQSVQQQVHKDTHAWSDRCKHLYERVT